MIEENLSKQQLAEKAVNIATKQLITSTEFKKPRMARIQKYWALYDNKIPKKLRQLFSVPIPVFPGMIDTLNAQYDSPFQVQFKEGDASDYFKVKKIDALFQNEILDSNQNSKWDSKLRAARKHAFITGRGILRYRVTSDPEYKSELEVVNLKNFHFQPRGGSHLENHLFCGEEDIQKTESELNNSSYDEDQVKYLKEICAKSDYLPEGSQEIGERLSRFKPLGLDPDNHSYVGEHVYKLAEWILTMNGERYYLLFHPWSKTWLRFEKWKDIDPSGLLPWKSFATHEDDENFLSKSFADDLYPTSDAIVALFNQELTNREKRNFGARAYDKEMFTDVRKLDESMHRPDALVPVDTKGGTRRISEGIYEFKVGELGGTVNLIDWMTSSLGRNTGATDLAMGGVQEVSKKASVTFAEQKSISKRVAWGSQPMQDMMADLGKSYIYGLKQHMPSKMAIRIMGENGWDWDEITRMDLSTEKDIDILIIASDSKIAEDESKSKKRIEALSLLMNSPNINSKKRDEEILRSIGGYSDQDIAEFLDIKTHMDKKALAKASESIQLILNGKTPLTWYGANIAFIQKMVDYANDKRSTLGDKFEKILNYAMGHVDIARQNIDKQIGEEVKAVAQQNLATNQGAEVPDQSQSENPGLPGGISKAMSVGSEMTV